MKTHVMTCYLRRNVLQPCNFIQKQNQKPPYQTVSHYCRCLLHTSILNRIPRRCQRTSPTNPSLWTATCWRGRICCTAVTQTKSRDWCWSRLSLLPIDSTRTFRFFTDGIFSDDDKKQNFAFSSQTIFVFPPNWRNYREFLFTTQTILSSMQDAVNFRI